MARSISNTDDYIDSRDIIARIDELEADEEAAQEEGAEPMDADDAAELETLRKFAEEAEGYASDWLHGAQFIHADKFEDYARELADDIGAVDSKAAWPTRHIDWTAAAEELKSDYTTVDFDGQEYLVR